jgi:uncharacterized membrane protein
MTNTIYVCVVTYLLRGHAGFLFWLAMAANVLLFVGMTALGWAMGRRTKIAVSREGATVDDSAIHAGDEVTIEKGIE